MICYHFTTKKALLQIKREKFLKPNTRLFSMANINKLHKKYGMSDKDYKGIKKFTQKLPKNKFIVAIAKERFKDWIKSGLIKDIYYFIKPKYRLEFVVPKNCKIFAREHVHQSPKEVKRKYEEKMYMSVLEPHKTNIWIKYFKSTKRIKNEKDLKSIKVPEIWLSCKIPLEQIKIKKLEIGHSKFY